MPRIVLVAGLTFALGLAVPARRAQAMDHDVRFVMVTSVYGLAAGTLLGLASLPFTQKARSIFIGSSVGLYVGAAIGMLILSTPESDGERWGQVSDPGGRFDPSETDKPIQLVLQPVVGTAGPWVSRNVEMGASPPFQATPLIYAEYPILHF